MPPGYETPSFTLDKSTQSITERRKSWTASAGNLFVVGSFISLSLSPKSIRSARGRTSVTSGVNLRARRHLYKRDDFKSGARRARPGQSGVRGVTAALVTGLSRENVYRESRAHVYTARVHRRLASRRIAHARGEREDAKRGPNRCVRASSSGEWSIIVIINADDGRITDDEASMFSSGIEIGSRWRQTTLNVRCYFGDSRYMHRWNILIYAYKFCKFLW